MDVPLANMTIFQWGAKIRWQVAHFLLQSKCQYLRQNEKIMVYQTHKSGQQEYYNSFVARVGVVKWNYENQMDNGWSGSRGFKIPKGPICVKDSQGSKRANNPKSLTHNQMCLKQIINSFRILENDFSQVSNLSVRGSLDCAPDNTGRLYQETQETIFILDDSFDSKFEKERLFLINCIKKHI